MNQIFITNLIAPTLLIDAIDNSFISLGVILAIPLVEWLAILWFCEDKLKVNKVAIFYLVFTANFISGFFGILLRAFSRFSYQPFNSYNLASNFIISMATFAFSIPIEYWAYWRYKPFQRHQKIRFRAAVVANLTSYSLIIFYIITISIGFPQPTKYSNPFGEIILATREIMQAQKAFYSANNKFTSNFAELPSLQLFIDKQNNSQAEGHYFNYTLMSDRATVEITFIPNENSRLPISYITLLRGEPFSYQICEFRDNTPLASPQIVENEIQCPPGSEKSGITINLE